MTDLQFRYLLNLYGGNGSTFSPGGGTFRPTGELPFGQTTPGFTDDLGHPMHPLPPNFPTEMTDRSMNVPFDNMASQDPRFVYNPDIGIPLGMGNGFLGLGGDQKVFDENEIRNLILSLRGSSPESLPNPAPPDNYFPGVDYGQRPDIPTYPPSDDRFPGGLAPEELFNPNLFGSPDPIMDGTMPDMETINWTPPPGMPPGQEMNFGASEFPNIPGGGNVSATDVGFPPPGIYPGAQYDFTGGPDLFTQNPSVPLIGENPAPLDMFDASTVATGAGNVTADQLANPPGIGDQFQWDQFSAPPADTSGPGFAGGAAGTPPTGYYGPVGPNTVGDTNPGLLPNASGYNYASPSQGMLDSEGNVIPGTAISASDAANVYNMQQFPGGGIGGFFKDAAGNILDSTGKLIASAADFAGKFGGSIANLVKGIPGALRNAGEDFVNALPKDWGGLGEGPGFFGMPNAPIQGTFGVNEPGVSRPGQGWAGTGITINDIRNSGIDPSYGNFAPGQVGRSSVPAPNSGMAFLGGGSRANVSALGSDALSRKLLQNMARAYFAGGRVPAAPQTRALVGGPPGNVFSQNFLKTHPLSSPSLSPFLPSTGPGSIVNPSAFATSPTPNRSIHFRPPATP
jgi:hypothetical protein